MAVVQTCVTRLLRNTFRCAQGKHLEQIAEDILPVTRHHKVWIASVLTSLVTHIGDSRVTECPRS